MNDRNENVESPPPKGAANGKIVIAGILTLTFLLGLFGYYVVPGILVGYLGERPAQTERLFDELERALLAYAVDHQGAFPPEHDLTLYRRNTKNLTKSRTPGMTTFRFASLTTPIRYIDPGRVGDPFAMPEQFVPPAYAVTAFGTILSSSGPNLVYDVRSEELQAITGEAALRELLVHQTYDPSNGARSGGDFFRVVQIPLDN